jgi:hypothetical protein
MHLETLVTRFLDHQPLHGGTGAEVGQIEMDPSALPIGAAQTHHEG